MTPNLAAALTELRLITSNPEDRDFVLTRPQAVALARYVSALAAGSTQGAAVAEVVAREEWETS